MSRKIERLINLTIALLATKRYLTKKQIFSSVEGYEGTAETKERMFERDKDDLRNLGVVIELGSFDPLFEDEAGYRIAPEGYALDLGAITGIEIALLSLAAEAWKGAALDRSAHSALTKLRSIGVDSDLDALPALAPRLMATHEGFQIITTAISKRERISFSYLSQSYESELRTIEPYAIATKGSHWYVAGRDVAKSALRTFRLDRIDSEVIPSKDGSGYEIPPGFDLLASLDLEQSVHLATVDIRKGKAQLMRNAALSIADKGEWDRITINYLDSRSFIDLLLWHGDDVLLIAPESVRVELTTRVGEIIDLHV